jgi:thymidylate synthase (FAD)
MLNSKQQTKKGGIAMVRLIDYWGSDDLIAQIAKLSHGNKSKKNTEEMIDMLIRLGHDSVFEFAGATFYVKTPIVVQRQWMRHRHMSYLERSLRYVKLDDLSTSVDKNRFVKPESYKVFEEMVNQAFVVYKQLIKEGVPAEIARMVLPLGADTEFYVSANLRSWLHFLKLRLDKTAQYEIRTEAELVYAQLSEIFPVTMYLWTQYNLEHKEV